MTVVEFHTKSEIEKAMIVFLRRLSLGIDLPPVTDRIEDHARRRACKLGFAEFKRTPNRGWKITSAGLAELVKVDNAR